ncbi:ATP-binding protein (plasmid) [Streptomyces sp. NBC_00637]|uniref:ATP-binding protein n=1 Tax=Streptomyces sp. NBC_00637 TaxID=2903667 RepID=UPI002F90DB8C
MTDTTEQLFASRPESVRQAREFAASALQGWGRTARADDVRLCVSELATNAVLHGTAPGRGFLLRINADDDEVRVEVHDSRDQQPRARAASSTDTSGRGLVLVDAISDGWGVEDRSPSGKVVWSMFKVPGMASC